MMETAIVQALVSLGPGGIVCWILLQQRKEDRADRLADRAERLDLEKDRLATDKRVAAALMALAMKITGKPIDGDQV